MDLFQPALAMAGKAADRYGPREFYGAGLVYAGSTTTASPKCKRVHEQSAQKGCGSYRRSDGNFTAGPVKRLRSSSRVRAENPRLKPDAGSVINPLGASA